MTRRNTVVLIGTTAAIAAMLLGATIASAATTLETGGLTQNKSVAVEATLASGTSTTLKTTSNSFQDTCTGSQVKGSTESPYNAATIGGNVSTLSFSGCTHTTHVVKPGSLSVENIAGTTNGTVRSTGAEVEVESTTYGVTLECTTASTDLGTLTGVKEGHATMHVNAVVNCGFFVPSAKWEGTYTVTSPTGLGVSP